MKDPGEDKTQKKTRDKKPIAINHQEKICYQVIISATCRKISFNAAARCTDIIIF